MKTTGQFEYDLFPRFFHFYSCTATENLYQLEKVLIPRTGAIIMSIALCATHAKVVNADRKST